MALVGALRSLSKCVTGSGLRPDCPIPLSALRAIRELFDAERRIQEAFHRPMKLTAETLIKSDRDTVWRLSQTPHLHTRWDLRFTDIEYLVWTKNSSYYSRRPEPERIALL